jgi:integrase
MWRGLRRTRLTARPRQKRGVTRAELERMVAPLSLDGPHDVRDAALLRVGFETMLRRSELVALQFQQLTVEADGSGSVLLERAKTDQEGEGALLYLSPATLERLRRWCTLAGITSGPLFRAIPRLAGPPTFDRPLQDRDVARIYQRRAYAVGIDAAQVAGHSLRIGATQDLLAAVFTGIEVQRQGRWKTERMVIRYGEKVATRRSAMARLLSTPATATPDAATRASAPEDAAKGD